MAGANDFSDVRVESGADSGAETTVIESTPTDAAPTADSGEGTQDDGVLDALGGDTGGSEASETLTEESGGESEDSEGKAEAKPAKGSKKSKADDDPNLDPDLAKYAAAKGHDLTELEKSPALQTAVRSQREAEKRMNQLQAEVDKLKRSETAEAAETVEQEGQKQKGESEGKLEDLSPVDRLSKDFETEVANACYYLGCANKAELREQYPHAWNRLQETYNDLYRDALREEGRWERTRDKERVDAEQKRRKLEDDYAIAKRTAQNNMDELRKGDAEIEKIIARTDSVKILDRLSRAFNVPVEYFKADKETITFFAEAAKAIDLVKSGKLQEKAKADVEKNIERAKKAELPASDSPLPDDHEAFSFANLQKQGRGISLRQ